jgi:hypothetical protein
VGPAFVEPVVAVEPSLVAAVEPDASVVEVDVGTLVTARSFGTVTGRRSS